MTELFLEMIVIISPKIYQIGISHSKLIQLIQEVSQKAMIRRTQIWWATTQELNHSNSMQAETNLIVQ